jgi:sirohydrochlorin cobaltochelatase
VVAVPLILLAAGHAKGDIPAALARERVRHPGLRTRYARPLGVHPEIIGLLRERLAASAQPRPDAVLLVGRGTTDPDANAELHRAARLLWETTRETGVEFVEPAFVSLARPSVGEGLERLARLGARRVTVLPYFLFAGVLPDRIVEHSALAAEQHGLEVTVGRLLGDTALGGGVAVPHGVAVPDGVAAPDGDALADLVLDRYAEAVAGPVSVNCDACVYRIAMPGFEDRVGAAQRPHDHPDDPAGHQHGHAHDHSSAHAHTHSHQHPGEHPHEEDHAARATQDSHSPVVRHTGPASVR